MFMTFSPVYPIKPKETHKERKDGFLNDTLSNLT